MIRYGQDVGTPFTYAGIQAIEKVLRRKKQYRFWSVDCYSAEENGYPRITNQVLVEDLDPEIEPSA